MPGAEVQFYVSFFTDLYKIAERDILTVVVMNIEVFWKTGPSPALKVVTVVSEELDATIFSVPAAFLYRSRLLKKFGYYFCPIDASPYRLKFESLELILFPNLT